MQKIKSVAYNSKKSMYEKALLWVTKALRAGVLSSYGVVVKLASAIFTGGIIKRIPEQTIGMVYSKIYKGIAEKAPIEGFVYGKSEVKFAEEFFNPKKL
jgi:predicted ATPase